jgi:hypothetical protein
MLLIFFLITVMNEKNSVNSMIHDSKAIGGGSYTSINGIRAAIKAGEINIANDPSGIAYTTMLSWAKYPLIDFSLMLFVSGSALPSNSPLEA